MKRPPWVWRHPRVVEQLARMQAMGDARELWLCGVACPETAAYAAEDVTMDRILDEVSAAGQPAMDADIITTAETRGEILIQHRLPDGSLLDGCTFTCSHLKNNQPILRGVLCVGRTWQRYIPSDGFRSDQPDWGMIRRPIPVAEGWWPVTAATETHVCAPSKSEAMRIMRTASVTELARFAAAHVEPRLHAERASAAAKAAAEAAMAAWESA